METDIHVDETDEEVLGSDVDVSEIDVELFGDVDQDGLEPDEESEDGEEENGGAPR